jgi:hypothetical protein
MYSTGPPLRHGGKRVCCVTARGNVTVSHAYSTLNKNDPTLRTSTRGSHCQSARRADGAYAHKHLHHHSRLLQAPCKPEVSATPHGRLLLVLHRLHVLEVVDYKLDNKNEYGGVTTIVQAPERSAEAEPVSSWIEARHIR